MEDDLFDETIWTPPDSLPDLSDEKLICIDVETKDPNLISRDQVGHATMDILLALLSLQRTGKRIYLSRMTASATCRRRTWSSGSRRS